MAGTSPAMTVRERLWVTPKGRWYYFGLADGFSLSSLRFPYQRTFL
jgi:hypothetical protein